MAPGFVPDFLLRKWRMNRALSHRRGGWLPALVLLASWAVRAEAQPPRALPDDVVRAWNEAVATVGWMAKHRDGSLAFQYRKDDLAEPVPAVW